MCRNRLLRPTACSREPPARNTTRGKARSARTGDCDVTAERRSRKKGRWTTTQKHKFHFADTFLMVFGLTFVSLKRRVISFQMINCSKSQSSRVANQSPRSTLLKLIHQSESSIFYLFILTVHTHVSTTLCVRVVFFYLP